MIGILTYRLLSIPLAVYVVPVIMFIVVASATYENSKTRFWGAVSGYDDFFDKAKPNYKKAALVAIFFALIIFIVDFLKFYSEHTK